MSEHLAQPIKSITVVDRAETTEAYQVGYGGVTSIEAMTKSGMYADIAYVRVWKGEHPFAEFCQHNILAVYFAEPEPLPPAPSNWKIPRLGETCSRCFEIVTEPMEHGPDKCEEMQF